MGRRKRRCREVVLRSRLAVGSRSGIPCRSAFAGGVAAEGIGLRLRQAGFEGRRVFAARAQPIGYARAQEAWQQRGASCPPAAGHKVERILAAGVYGEGGGAVCVSSRIQEDPLTAGIRDLEGSRQ